MCVLYVKIYSFFLSFTIFKKCVCPFVLLFCFMVYLCVLYHYDLFHKSRDSSVGIATRLLAGRSGF
jgi:hypothetical protein